MLIEADELKRQVLLGKEGLEEKSRGPRYLMGIDEVGRGPLFGDVVASAVLIAVDDEFDAQSVWHAMTDSKKLTESRRDQLFELIKEQAIAYAISRATSIEIDQINILQASLLAMQRAYEQLVLSLGGTQRAAILQQTGIIVDGRHVPPLSLPAYAVVGGDSHFRCIGAASILAKVQRDREMAEIDKKYPGYGLAQHKGYPTKLHREALEKLGPTEQHRRSFGPVKRLLESV